MLHEYVEQEFVSNGFTTAFSEYIALGDASGLPVTTESCPACNLFHQARS